MKRQVSKLLSFLLSSLFVSFTLCSSASAVNYSASISTSGNISLATTAGTSVIGSSAVSISTNCRAGYNLTLATSVNNNNLYLDGDITNNTSGTYIAPSDGTTALRNAPNTWGYLLPASSLTIPDETNVFLPVSSSLLSPTVLKTPTTTASQTDIEDEFRIYYGSSTSASLSAGSYKLIPSNTETPPVTYGGLVYYLTMDTSCNNVVTLDITFNKNLDGAGGESGDTVSNFPDPSENTLNTNNHTLTLSNKTPTRTGYAFKEWNTSPAGAGDYYHPGSVISIGDNTSAGELSGNVTLYAIWIADCPANSICYNGNHAEAGSMSNQTGLTAGNYYALIPSNFSRSGYGFLGWSTNPEATPNSGDTIYGPNQNYRVPTNGAGTNLYAVWLAATGTLQNWAGASNMNVGDVIALRDNRDDEVYTVAKLADNNVWITENLRLIPNSNVTITSQNTNSPASDFLSAYSSSSSSDMCATDDDTCDDSIQYNTNNINRSLTASHDANDNATSWYSYGVMYNWYTATAGNGLYSRASGSVSGDLCPAGWHLPTGGSDGEWGALNTAVNSGSTKSDVGLRTYPVNIIRSGDYNPSDGGGTGRNTQGRIWSATAMSTDKAYRMGYSGGEVNAAISKSWNKWDGFAIRCIYQGGNIHYDDVDITFAGAGITSLTFTNPNFPTETATPSSSTVSLAENVTYTVTATLSSGYEIASWVTTSGGSFSDVSTDPAINPNTFTTTDDTTITVTGQLIPSYEVTVNLGINVRSISFTSANYTAQTVTNQDPTTTSTGTATLKRGVTYILTSSYEAGYSADTWTTTANGTLGSNTGSTNTYVVTGTATLGLSAIEADELTYTLIYNAGSGTDAPNTVTVTSYENTYNFTITNSTPIYYGYTFIGWTETQGGSTVSYASGDTLTVTSTGTTTTKTLYPVYQTVSTCPANKICYYENGADVLNAGRGTMANQSAASNSTAKLIPTNYSRTGYGFAGWTTVTDNNGTLTPDTTYGPNATINTPDLSSTGLSLYAKWIAPTGDLQSWRGCNSLVTNEVIALSDTRDNNAYAVAKLADGNCWTIENLRLVPNTATITSANTHNPTSDFITEAASSSSSNALCDTDDSASCVNQLQFNTNSLDRSLTQSYNTAGNNVAWYSYGVYYNWYTATAGNGTFSTGANTNVTGDLCPKNWHLPTSTSTGEWAALNTVVNGGVTNADAGLRSYPVNLVWSGDYNGSSRTSGYSNGRYWSSTSFDANNAYRMGHQESGSKGATPSGNFRKWDGFAIRCIRDEITTEYYNVTVTLPEHVASITFESSNYSTETATSGNLTVSLAENVTYTITANFSSGYELDEWSNGSNSTIGNVTTNPTTFTVSNTSSLTVTSREIAPPNCASSPAISTIAPGVTYMQDITSSNYSTILSNMSTTTSYKIKDSRDNQNYCIAKLADNKIWMTSNLNIAGGTALSATDTDVDASYISSFTTSNNLTKTGDTIVLPASSTSGFDTNNYSFNYNSNSTTCGDGSPCYSYYSWDAATLGSGRSIATDNENAPYSICPKGWHLPTTYNGSGAAAEATDLRAIMIALGGSNTIQSYTSSTTPTGATMSAALQSSPNNFLLAGNYSSGSFNSGGSYGPYWSATSYTSSNYARYMYFGSDIVDTASFTYRYLGISVRCVLNEPANNNNNNQQNNPQNEPQVNNLSTNINTNLNQNQSSTSTIINNTTNNTPDSSTLTETYSAPEGVIKFIKDPSTVESDAPIGLIILSTTATISGIFIFALAHRQNDDEDVDKEQINNQQ